MVSKPHEFVEDGARALGEVLINPVKYRSEILTAVKISHKEEVLDRYVYFDSRRGRTRLPIETSRCYKDSTPTLEIDVIVSKVGFRFRLEGMITDKALCQSFTVFCYIKTLPIKSTRRLESDTRICPTSFALPGM